MSNLEKALGIAGRKHSDVSDEHMVDILAIVKQAWDEVESLHKYIAELEAEIERQLLFNRGGWTCAVCGEFVPGNDKKHIHDSAKIIAELKTQVGQAELLRSALDTETNTCERLMQCNIKLRAEIERINNFDVEDFISSLRWSHPEEVNGYRYSIESLEGIIAGNIRNFYFHLVARHVKLDEFD
jgi:hypothetical protein